MRLYISNGTQSQSHAVNRLLKCVTCIELHMRELS